MHCSALDASHIQDLWFHSCTEVGKLRLEKNLDHKVTVNFCSERLMRLKRLFRNIKWHVTYPRKWYYYKTNFNIYSVNHIVVRIINIQIYNHPDYLAWCGLNVATTTAVEFLGLVFSKFPPTLSLKIFWIGKTISHQSYPLFFAFSLTRKPKGFSPRQFCLVLCEAMMYL